MGLTRVRGPDLWGLQLYLFAPGGRGPGRGWDHDIPMGRAKAKGKDRRVQEVETGPGEGRMGRIAKRGRGGEPNATGSHRIKGENTPIESLLDVLGITETQREKETNRESAVQGRLLSPSLIPTREGLNLNRE